MTALSEVGAEPPSALMTSAAGSLSRATACSITQAQQALAGPVGELPRDRLDARGGHRVAAADGDQPVDDLDVDRIGQGIGGDGRGRGVAVVEEFERELEPGRVERGGRGGCRGGDRRQVGGVGRRDGLRRVAVLGDAVLVRGRRRSGHRWHRRTRPGRPRQRHPPGPGEVAAAAPARPGRVSCRRPAHRARR